MIQEVEISSFDLRYQSHRMKNAAAEKKLLTSIQENSIREPLQGVDIATPQSTQPPQPPQPPEKRGRWVRMCECFKIKHQQCD